VGFRLYPGSDGGFWCSDLEQFTAKSAQGELRSEQDVGEYRREFSKIANRLLADEQVTPGDADIYYKRGIPQDFFKKIDNHFRKIGRHARGYAREAVYEAALAVSNEQKEIWGYGLKGIEIVLLLTLIQTIAYMIPRNSADCQLPMMCMNTNIFSKQDILPNTSESVPSLFGRAKRKPTY
jgi:hypothetical protein